MRKFLILVIILMTQLTQINAQELQKNLFDSYEQFQEKAITKRRFGHATLVNLLEKLKANPLFDVQIAEKSTEGRAIYQVKIGNGPIKVLLWSQMHGNEATATMALMDIFNFLEKIHLHIRILKRHCSKDVLFILYQCSILTVLRHGRDTQLWV
jgi:hypothetical protein